MPSLIGGGAGGKLLHYYETHLRPDIPTRDATKEDSPNAETLRKNLALHDVGSWGPRSEQKNWPDDFGLQKKHYELKGVKLTQMI